MSDHEDKFQHLTEEQLEELYTRYMQGEKVKALLEFYDIDLSPSLFIRAFPPKVCENLACPYCQVAMFQRRPARQASSWKKDPAFCKTCAHLHHSPDRYHDTPQCHCPPCRLIQEQLRLQRERERRESIVAALASGNLPPVRLTTLGIRQKLYLMALLETCLDWRQNHLRGLAAIGGDACVTPTPALDEALLRQLYDEHVLLVDPMSPLSAFGEGPTPEPCLERVRWLVNVHLGDGQRAQPTHVHRALLEELSCGPLPAWREDIAQLIQELALEEVYSFLEGRCAEHGMELYSRNKSREAIEKLLSARPVCHLWALANSAVNNAVTYASKAGISMRQASNGIPRSLDYYHGLAIEDKWSFKRWNANSTRQPRSGLGKALHGLLLRHADFGRERLLADYIAALPGGSYQGCPACGSVLVHLQARVGELVINCKDCMARTVLPADSAVH